MSDVALTPVREAHRFDIVIDPGYLDVAFPGLFDPATGHRRYRHDQQYRQHESAELGGEQAILVKKFSHVFILLGN